MAVTVRPADCESDRSIIIAMLRALTPHSDERRFDWLYRQNPHGPARAWIAEDEGHAIGMAAAFPRRLLVRGDVREVWVLGDFYIDSQYRSLGPAIQLQRAVLDAVQRATMLAGYYDFPSRPMAAVYKRIGIRDEGTLIRMAKPLRADRVVSALCGPMLSKIVSPLVNVGLAVGVHVNGTDPAFSVQSHTGRFGSEFDRLVQEAGAAYLACIERSADYLNWRYADHPSEQYECLVARQSGRLCGYVIFSCAARDAILFDVFSLNLESIPYRLLRRLAKDLWKRGVFTVSASVVEGHPWRNTLERAGFRARETSPFIVSPGPNERDPLFKEPGASWYFMQGDRDS
ncbi:MAG: GNAT family N-acetyltransferase [Nitrospira sp.]|nr:GNAT family N-acetyltransferase [Nitrospira sp.]